jgi:predicted RNA binding protein YcfA (HicA-like mRNA interferase family)
MKVAVGTLSRRGVRRILERHGFAEVHRRGSHVVIYLTDGAQDVRA